MATNFLHATGTNGFIATPFTVIGSTELNAVANAAAIISSTNGSSGQFNQTNFAHAQYGYFYATTGASSGWQPTAGGNLTGWYIHSPDGGTTWQTTLLLPPASPPDFIIPLSTATAMPASAIVGVSTIVPLPYDTVKICIVNNSGATTASVNNTITCAPVADQY